MSLRGGTYCRQIDNEVDILMNPPNRMDSRPYKRGTESCLALFCHEKTQEKDTIYKPRRKKKLVYKTGKRSREQCNQNSSYHR